MLEKIPFDILDWCSKNWPFENFCELFSQKIPQDGSNRLFIRLEDKAGKKLIAIFNPDNKPENLAHDYFTGHFSAIDLPVAKIWAKDLDKGYFLVQDLGKDLFMAKACELKHDKEEFLKLYDPVLELMAKMQSKGAKDLNTSFCFDGVELTPEFLRKREIDYFLFRFVEKVCGLSPKDFPLGLDKELDEICEIAGTAKPKGLVHRDFQSRNILLRGINPSLVDFQGARLGPYQYDLASLLHDPYVDMAFELRDLLLNRYLEIQEKHISFDKKEFLAAWPFVSLSRVMQALGAYGFLTRVKKREHSACYINPALVTLRLIAKEPSLKRFEALGLLLDSLPLSIKTEDLSPRYGGEDK